MGDYRTILRGKGLYPVVIERTSKQPGDKVLIRTDRPAQVWGVDETAGARHIVRSAVEQTGSSRPS